MVRKWDAQLKLKRYRMVFLVFVPKYLFPSLGTWRGEPLSRVLFLKDRASNVITVLATVGGPVAFDLCYVEMSLLNLLNKLN